MELTISPGILREAVRYCRDAIPAKAIRPELACVRLVIGKDAAVESTDLEVGVRVSLPDADCDGEGEILIDSARLSSILAVCHGNMIRINSGQGETLKIDCDGTEYKLAKLSGDFPEVCEQETGNAYALDAGNMLHILRTARHAAATDSARYTMTGILWHLLGDKVRMVTTDGRRLVVAGPEFMHQREPIVPARACNLIDKLLSSAGEKETVAVLVGRKVTVRLGNVIVQTATLQGKFPDYQAVIPTKPAQLTWVATAGQMADLVRQVTAVHDETSRIDLSVDGGRITAKSKTTDGEGVSHLEVEISKQAKAQIALNWKYLLDAMKSLDTDLELHWHYHGEKNPLLVTADDYQYLLMPLS